MTSRSTRSRRDSRGPGRHARRRAAALTGPSAGRARALFPPRQSPSGTGPEPPTGEPGPEPSLLSGPPLRPADTRSGAGTGAAYPPSPATPRAPAGRDAARRTETDPRPTVQAALRLDAAPARLRRPGPGPAGSRHVPTTREAADSCPTAQAGPQPGTAPAHVPPHGTAGIGQPPRPGRGEPCPTAQAISGIGTSSAEPPRAGPVGTRRNPSLREPRPDLVGAGQDVPVVAQAARLQATARTVRAARSAPPEPAPAPAAVPRRVPAWAVAGAAGRPGPAAAEPPRARTAPAARVDRAAAGARPQDRDATSQPVVLPRAAAIAAARDAVRRVRRTRTAAGTAAATVAPARAEPAATPPQVSRAARWAAVTDRLPLWLHLRCGVELKTVAAVTVVLLTAVGFAAQHFWSGRPETVRAPVAQVRSTPVASPSRTGAPAGGRITVDVAGKVEHPGVLELPRGSRVTDALEAAGGPKPGTDVQNLNQARRLVDGEQIVVGAAPAPGAGSAGGAAGAASSAPGRVSLSSASAEQLETLPGIGPVLAQHIIDYRNEHAGFTSVGQLRNVSGIGAHRFAELKPKVGP